MHAFAGRDFKVIHILFRHADVIDIVSTIEHYC